MALPATHIRFAATIADRLAVTDQAAYLSGTLYPDSRWVTGIDRRRTHSAQCLRPDFASDDFTLGWHIHCVCDRIQGDLHNGLLPELDQLAPDAQWVRTSAAKVVQDMKDAVGGGIDNYLNMLTESHAPNGESVAKVSAYLAMVRRAYRNGGAPDWSDYVRLWTGVGLDPQRIDRIGRQVRQILADAELVDALNDAFARMVDQWVARHASGTQHPAISSGQIGGGRR